MNKSQFIVIALFSILLVSMFTAFVAAESQYRTYTTPVTIPSDGTFTATVQAAGIAYEIQGTPGATGSVTADFPNGNQHTSASIPNGVKLSYFVTITFNIDAADFMRAKIFITYTDSDVSGIQLPFAVYKYVPSGDIFVEVSSTVDTANKMVIVTVNSIDDPLFAIGGVEVPPEIPFTSWVILSVSAIIIIVLVVFGVWYFKKRSA